MYGYVIPDKTKLRAQDFVLFRAFYCGICCQTGKLFGQLARFTTNFDITFLTALLFDYAQSDLIIEEHTCVLNPVRKKATVMPCELLEKIAAVNLILAYGKTLDGTEDREGAKYGVARLALKRGYKKAVKLVPEAQELFVKYMGELSAKEKCGEKSVDRVADCFASLYREVARLLLKGKADEVILSLCYNVGKFVYLADAVDDATADTKKHRYNPFVAAYGECKNKKEFLAAHKEIEQSLAFCVNRAAGCFNELKFTQSYTLLRNVIYDGMRSVMNQLLEGDDKPLKPPKI